MPTADSVTPQHQPTWVPGKTASSGNRDGWLRAMEREGLHRVLSQVRRFEFAYGDQGDQVRPSAPTGRNGSHMPSLEADEEPDVPGPATRHRADGPVQRGAPAEPAGGSEGTARVTANDLAIGLFLRGDSAHGAAGRSGGALKSAIIRPPYQDLSPSRVSVLNAAEGLEVWVRDAAIPGTEGRSLVTRMKDVLSSIGARLQRLSLNGKPLYVAPRGGEHFRKHSEK